MTQTSVVRRGCTIRRAATTVVAVILAASLAACGSSSAPRTVTDSGGAGAQTPTTTSTPTTSTPTTSTPTTSTPTTSTPTTPSGATTPTPAGGPHPLTVSPATGTPRTELTFGFSSRSVTYSAHQLAVTYSLSIRGPTRAGCIGVHGVAVPVTRVGPVSVTVGPAQLGGSWCTGSYTARVEEIAHPVCAAGTMCPQFIRIVASFGPAAFRIG